MPAPRNFSAQLHLKVCTFFIWFVYCSQAMSGCISGAQVFFLFCFYIGIALSQHSDNFMVIYNWNLIAHTQTTVGTICIRACCLVVYPVWYIPVLQCDFFESRPRCMANVQSCVLCESWKLFSRNKTRAGMTSIYGLGVLTPHVTSLSSH